MTKSTSIIGQNNKPKRFRYQASYSKYVYVLINHNKQCVRTFNNLKALVVKGNPGLKHQTLKAYFSRIDKPTIYSNKRITIYKQVLEKKMSTEQYFNYRLTKLKKLNKIAKFKAAFQHFSWYIDKT